MEQQQLQHKEPEAQTVEVVKRLSSRKVAERAEAEQALEQMGPEAVEALLALLQQEARKRKRNIRLYIGLCAGLMVSLVIGTIVFDLNIAGMTGAFGALSGLLAATQTQKNAATALAKYDDLRGVGPLAEAMEFDDKNVRAEAEKALIRLLPNLNASHAHFLNDDQRRCLNRALWRKNVDLTCAILKAYEQVGDETALPHVERLANGKAATAKEKRIRQAAIDCLPFLKESIERERARQTLLRPAAAPDDPAAVLLRPAQGVTEGDPDLLLRPGVPPETDH